MSAVIVDLRKYFAMMRIVNDIARLERKTAATRARIASALAALERAG